MIVTIGHSTLSVEEFLALCSGAGVEELWDVRSFPVSRWAWFRREELAAWLPAAGVAYRWEKRLGGRRGPRPAPPAQPPAAAVVPPGPNAGAAAPPRAAPAPPGQTTLLPPPREGWRNEAFENYMWHTATGEFAAAAGELLLAGRRRTVAIMCAEALWWRCHRSMIADYLVSAGAEVVHLQPERTPHAAVAAERLERYDPEVLAAWTANLGR